MFLQNKYTKYYYNIINRAKERTGIIGYTEKHHIVPKSLGGNNKKDNIATLTTREHFVCHWLLTKMTMGIEKQKMCYAWFFFKAKSDQLRITSRTFSAMRDLHSAEVTGKKNPMFNKHHSEETKTKQSAAKKGYKPASCGWNKGIPHTAEAKLKNSIANTGEKNGAWKRKRTKEEKEAVSKAQSKPIMVNGVQYESISKAAQALNISPYKVLHIDVMPIITCSHCGLTGRACNMKRYHFDKCKIIQNNP